MIIAYMFLGLIFLEARLNENNTSVIDLFFSALVQSKYEPSLIISVPVALFLGIIFWPIIVYLSFKETFHKEEQE